MAMAPPRLLLGIAYRSLGDFSRAIEHHTQCLAIAKEVGDRAGEGDSGNNLGLALEKNGDLPAAARAFVQGLASKQRVERDVGAHDRRVSLFEQQQRTYMLLQGVLLVLGQRGWALGVAVQAKACALARTASAWQQRRRRERRRLREERSVRGGVRRVVGRGAGASARPGRRRRWQRAARPRVLAAV